MAARKRVVVVGSGAAGLAAAVSAASDGAAVTLLEAAALLGGTTATSGGAIWLPANPWAAAHGVVDSPESALRYLSALDLGDTDPSLADAYVRGGVAAIKSMEARSAVRWEHQPDRPDYHAEFEGGGDDRSLEISPVQVPHEAIAMVRADPYGVPPLTVNEERSSSQPDRAELARREREGIVVRGRGLVAALCAALRECGGVIHTGTRATRLLTSKGAVVGVEAGGREFDGEVVITTGGFERDPGLIRTFLRGPMLAPAGPPSNRGDGLRMGMTAGAALGNMSEAWWCAAMAVPGETFDGAPFFRMLFLDLAKPGGLVVDGAGRRFVNEAANYSDFGRAMHAFDAANYAYPGASSWLVFDSVRRANPLGPLRQDRDPDWLESADSLERLAESIGVPVHNLCQTVERFNGYATTGVDLEFGRGSYIFDAFSADAAGLSPVSEPPFYALRILPGCLGTRGGLRTDEHGRVLRADLGDPIAGLYAAGNASANCFGCAYPGPGSTVGPALVFGWFAGQTAASVAA